MKSLLKAISRCPFPRVPFLFLFLITVQCLSPIVLAQDNCDNQEPNCTEPLYPDLKFKYISSSLITLDIISQGQIFFEIASGGTVPYRYQLVLCGCEPKDASNRVILYTNPKNVFVDLGPIMGLYTSVWPKGEHIKVVTARNKIFNAEVRKSIEAGDIDTINFDDDGVPSFDNLGTKVDVSVITSANAPKYFATDAVKPGLVIPVEKTTTALQRAECIKLIGMLFNQVDEVSSKFDKLDQAYKAAEKFAMEKAIRRPSVFFNFPYLVDQTFIPDRGEDNFAWDQPARNSYLVSLLNDARADYLYSEEDFDNPLNYDQILFNFKSARILINSGRTDVMRADRTTTQFINQPISDKLRDGDTILDRTFTSKVARKLIASRCGTVWSNQKNFVDLATDFEEGGVFRPDQVLRDFIKIFHPYIADDKHEMVYQYNLASAPLNETEAKGCPFKILAATPEVGRKSVDFQFEVKGSSRFTIDQSIEEMIIPEIVKLLADFDIDEQRLELYYPADVRGAVETILVVRAAVKEGDIEAYTGSSDIVLEALRGTIVASEVRETALPSPSPSITPSVSPTPSTSPQPASEGSSGLSGGAIAGIVILFIVLALLIYCVFIWRRRRTQPITGGGSNQNEADWEDNFGGGGRPGAGTSGGGLFGRGRRGAGEPIGGEGGDNGRRDSDPFAI